MRIGRLILVVATLVTILVFPLLMRDALQALRLPSAYAAPNALDPGGRVYQNGNNDDDDDDDDNNNNNDESDNEGEEDDGNDNVECYVNLNDNEPVPCDFAENDNEVVYVPTGNDNDGYTAPAPEPAPPPPSAGSSGGSGASASRCFGSTETGNVFLDAPLYDVTVTVVPGGSLGSDTRLTLNALDPATVPMPPAGSTLLDAAVWQIGAQSGCEGAGINQLPGAVNLGFAYDVPANKAKLQIVRLEGGAWVEVPTSPDPDPNKPYISATIQTAGTYAVIQKP